MADLGAATMPGNETEEAPSSKRCQKRRGLPEAAVDSKTELRKRAKQAATEYFLKLGTSDEIAIPDLARKHGAANIEAVHRAVIAMALWPQAAGIALAREFMTLDTDEVNWPPSRQRQRQRQQRITVAAGSLSVFTVRQCSTLLPLSMSTPCLSRRQWNTRTESSASE